MIETLPSGVKIAKLTDLEHIATNYDMLFFHGDGPISDLVEFIELLTRDNNKFSHIGMYTTPHLYPDQEDLFNNEIHNVINNGLILESTANTDLSGKSDGVPDLITNKYRIGVQLRHAQQVIQSYYDNSNTYVALARIKNNPWKNSANQTTLQQLSQIFLNTYHNRYYELNFLNLLASAFVQLRRYRDFANRLLYGSDKVKAQPLPDYQLDQNLDHDTVKKIVDNLEDPANAELLFCSELCAMIYKMIKLIPEGILPANVVPVDFLHFDLFVELIYIVPDNHLDRVKQQCS